MKRVNYLFAILLILLSCKQSAAEKSILRIVIDRNMTQQQLTDLIVSANSINIKLNAKIEGYNRDGSIKKINGVVEVGETGFGTFASDNLGKIIITQNMNSVNGGFSIIVKNKWI